MLGQRQNRVNLMLALVMLAIVTCLLAAATPVGAQEDNDDQLSGSEQGIEGALEAGGEPVPGVLMRVSQDGSAVGEAVTEGDGTWRVAVPAAGVYQVELVADTLPEDVELRNPDRTTLDNVRVSANRDQRVRFAFDDVAAGGVSFADKLANTIWNGLKFGLVVALCSVGLSIVFGATKLVNFAHAELITFGALAAWFFNSPTMWVSAPLLLAGFAAMVFPAAAAAGIHVGLWRPLERRRVGLVQMMIVSIGLGLLIRYSFAVVFNASPRTYTDFVAQKPWTFGPLVFPPKDLTIIPLCIGVLVVVALLMQRSRLGTGIRAVADNPDLAEASGIDVQRTVLFVWIIAGALAGLGGLIFGITQSVQWDMGFTLLLTVFAAVILGGIGSVYGPMIGGVVVGMVSELSTLWVSSEFKIAISMAALIVVLMIRPQGILGIKERIG